MLQRLLLTITRWALSAFLLGFIVYSYTRILPANATTAAVTFLLLVLLTAAYSGLRNAIAIAIAAALCLNYFFIIPLYTFTVAQSEDWIALISFLASALIGSNLSERIQKKAADAERNRAELECLYDFAQRLLVNQNTADLLRNAPVSIVAAFNVHAAAFYVAEIDALTLAGPAEGISFPDTLRQQLLNSVGEHPRSIGPKSAILPVSLGVRPIGAVYLACSPSAELPALVTLEALASLIALSVERAGAVDKLARSDAARESEQLRSALLDAVTHDLRTPLTSIKASVTTLLLESDMPEGISPAQRAELLSIIDEESDRLNRLIAQATEMAAIEATMAHLDARSTQIPDIVHAVLSGAGDMLISRTVHTHLPPDLPAVLADPALIGKVLAHLLENAHKYSTAHQTIEISAWADTRSVSIAVADAGPGIDLSEQSLIFEKFYRGREHRYRAPGTGMGLAICKAILEAHRGSITLNSRKGESSTFTLTLPIVDEEIT